MDPEILAGAGALVTALGGVATALMGTLASKREERIRADEECQDKLRLVRQRAEQLADELHELRMRRS